MGFLTQKVRIVCGQLIEHGGDHLFIPACENFIHVFGKTPIAAGCQRIRETADNQLLFFA